MRLVPPIVLVLALLAGGCSLPRLIVLNDPLDARQHNDLGVAYEQRGEAGLALREYERAAELDGGWARPLINRGNVLAASRDWLGAEKSYRQALRRDPQAAEAMNNLAWVLLQTGEWDAALDYARQAATLDPLQPAYLDTLAEILIARKAIPEARATLEKALSLNPPAPLRAELEGKLALLDD